jgi:YD repeat-containing protein
MKRLNQKTILCALTTVLAGAVPLWAQTDVHVNAGGAAYVSKVGNTTVASWDADRGFTGGTAISTTSAIDSAIAGATISADDQKLYQNQHAGASLVFSTPVTNSTYTVTLFFAEIEGKAVGARKFGVKIEDASVLTDFDIAKEAGGPNRALSRAFSTTITDGKLDIELTGTTGDAAIAGISLSLPSKTSIWGAGGGSSALASPSLEALRPFDTIGGGGGAGPSSADEVDLVSGVERHAPPADIVGRNPIGPDAPFSRTYKSSSALAGLSAPGMATGWNTGWDFSMRPSDATTWSALTLSYPDGAGQTFTPNLNGADADGTFTGPRGERLKLSGTKGATVGAWSQLTFLFSDLTTWTFSPSAADANVYVLSKITNNVGKSLVFERDAAGKMLSVKNDAGTTLLAMTYDGDGHLNVVSNNTGQAVKYSFGAAANTQELLSVSQLSSSADVTTAPAQWSYAYTAQAGAPLLTGVSFASATGAGLTSHPITYDGDTGRVTNMTDALGNARSYEYIPGATRITVKDQAGATALQWVEKFDEAGRTTGFTDANGQSGTIAYGDPNNPMLGTSFKNRLGQTTNASYDALGNILSVVSPRGIVSRAVYDFVANPFGLLSQVRVITVDGTPRTITLGRNEYNALGQLTATYALKPGATDGTLVKTDEFTYTPLGNVATHGSLTSAGTMGQTVFGYTTDGAFSQAEALGQAITVTDPLGRITHCRYDATGRATQITSPRGNTVSYSYTPAGQVAEIVFPKVGATAVTNARTRFTYASAKGDCIKIEDLDESGAVIRTGTPTRNAESAPLGATSAAGSPSSGKVALDGINRLAAATDSLGNNTSQVYDAVGNVTQSTIATGDTRSTNYDADSKVTDATNASGQKLTFSYANDDGRLTKIEYPEAGTLASMTAEYDGLNRLTKITDSASTRTYSYDDASRLLSVVTTYTGMTNPAAVSYAYNDNGSLKSMTTPAGATNYTYDAAGQMTQLQVPWNAGMSYKYTYLDDGLLKIQETSKIKTSFGYNARGWPSSMLNIHKLGTTLSNASSFSGIKYDNFGHVTGYSLTYGASQTGKVRTPSSTVTLKYDSAFRLIGEERKFTDVTSLAAYNYGFTRDATGHLVQTRDGQPIVLGKLKQDTANTINKDGDVTQDATYGAFIYDTLGRPTAVTGKTTNGWRSDSKRAWRGDGAGNGKLFYLYDEMTGNLVAELDGTGALVTGQSSGPLGLVQRYKAASSEYTSFTFDPMGNLVSRHKQPSTLPDTIAIYDAMGGARSDLSTGSGLAYPANDPIGAGAQWGMMTDEALKGTANGLPLSSSRYYDPVEGRFLSLEDRFGPLTTPVENPDGGYAAFVDNNYEWVQTVGEIASFAPGVGAAVNIANGSLDIREGHYLSGGLQVVGGVFELGTIAKAGVVAAKAEVAAEQMGVRVSETAAEEAGTASRNATNAVAEESGAASKGCLNGTCFMAGTLVTMADGSLRPIEQIREGDQVLSKNEVSGKVEAKRVSHAFAKHATLVLSLHLSSGETIEATGDHPFYVQGKGWTPARECGIGTSIVTRAGPSVQVEAVERHERDETVFNLTIEDDYSFFVGKTGAWTHNAKNCPGQLQLPGLETQGGRVHLNSHDAVSEFGIYEINVNGSLNKIGKADLLRVTKSSGLPTRLHQQLRLLGKIHGEENVAGAVVENLGSITTKRAEAVEHARITTFVKDNGYIPPGNIPSYKP